MNSSQIGSAAWAPVSFLPSETRLSSLPTHTPAVICGVKPMYQASVKSLVVPVFRRRAGRVAWRDAGAELHDFLEHGRHRARHFRLRSRR